MTLDEALKIADSRVLITDLVCNCGPNLAKFKDAMDVLAQALRAK